MISHSNLSSPNAVVLIESPPLHTRNKAHASNNLVFLFLDGSKGGLLLGCSFEYVLSIHENASLALFDIVEEPANTLSHFTLGLQLSFQYHQGYTVFIFIQWGLSYRRVFHTIDVRRRSLHVFIGVEKLPLWFLFMLMTDYLPRCVRMWVVLM
jgi:hypothetical protein